MYVEALFFLLLSVVGCLWFLLSIHTNALAQIVFIYKISCVGGFGSNSYMYKINGTANINAVRAASEQGNLISKTFSSPLVKLLFNLNKAKVELLSSVTYLKILNFAWIVMVDLMISADYLRKLSSLFSVRNICLLCLVDRRFFSFHSFSI